METTTFAILYAVSTGFVVIFQGCLAAGLPWGAASMGGKYPGKYPPKMRVVALINMIVLSLLAVIVLTRAELLFPQLYTFSRYAIWAVVVFGFIGVVLNSITKSRVERVWIPVAAVQFVSSMMVALI